MKKISESYFYNSRPEMLRFLPLNYAIVLEVGCGAGAFRALISKDIEYWGVDPYHKLGSATNINAYKFFQDLLENIQDELPDNYFDLIIINDVMEHTSDHLAFLSRLKKKMTCNGYIVGSVPNVRYITNLKDLLIHRDWAYQESGGILDKTHLRFFTKKSLCNSFKDAQFQLEVCEGINPIWHSTYRSREAFKKLIYGFLGLFLGRDIPYLQFGFRFKNVK